MVVVNKKLRRLSSVGSHDFAQAAEANSCGRFLRRAGVRNCEWIKLLAKRRRDMLFSEFHKLQVTSTLKRMMITRPVYLRDESDQPLSGWPSGFRSLPE